MCWNAAESLRLSSRNPLIRVALWEVFVHMFMPYVFRRAIGICHTIKHPVNSMSGVGEIVGIIVSS